MIKIKDSRLKSALFPMPLAPDLASKNDIEQLQARLNALEADLIMLQNQRRADVMLTAVEADLIKPPPPAPSVHKSLEMKGAVQRDSEGKIVSISFLGDTPMKGTIQRDSEGKIVSLSFLGDTPIKARVQRDSEGKFSGVLIVEQKKTLLTDYLV